MGHSLRLLTVVGARPQIIKAAAISRAIEKTGGRIVQTLLHTGQHYDVDMSQQFFDELQVPRPDHDLGVGPAAPQQQLAQMIDGIRNVLRKERFDLVLLYGDTNSTLAGTRAAAELNIPIAHVEAGLRSFNDAMPEEFNRITCDQHSAWLFCPTNVAVRNLEAEGIVHHQATPPNVEQPAVLLTGDVMFDNSLHFATLAAERSTTLKELGLAPGSFMLATVHRQGNTDDPARLAAIMEALMTVARSHDMPVILPLHPRTRSRMDGSLHASLLSELVQGHHVRLIPPAGFLDMIALEEQARMVLTDSGGVQKEAYFFKKPCVVLREETEWTELVDHGQARLTGADPDAIVNAVAHFMHQAPPPCAELYGDGHAAERICTALLG